MIRLVALSAALVLTLMAVSLGLASLGEPQSLWLWRDLLGAPL